MSDAVDTPEPAPNADPRLHALDGLRGIAAVFVVAFHVFLSAEFSETASTVLLAGPFGLLVNGPGAVHIFFVLSGFVLALTLSRDTGPGRLPRFYVRRIFRIHPPYMAAVLFAWAAASIYPRLGTPGAQCFHIPAHLLPRALAFPSMAFGQLPVGWSLFVELAMSVVFPLLFLLGRRLHPLVPVLLGLPLLFEIDPRLRFLRFTIDFALGAWLFLERDRVALWASRLPGSLRAAWVVLAIVLLQAPYALAVYQTGSAGLEQGNTPPVIFLMALGSTLLVAASLHVTTLRRAFSSKLAVFFGRISYSLYLVHVTVLVFLVCRGNTTLHYGPGGAVLVFAATLGISVVISMLGWRFVESPSIAAGRALIRGGEALARQVRS